MPDRKPCEFGGAGNVQKHLRSSWVGCRSLSQYHSTSSLSTRFMHLAFQCANPSERGMTGRKPKTKYLAPTGLRGLPFFRRMNVELCQEADKQEADKHWARSGSKQISRLFVAENATNYPLPLGEGGAKPGEGSRFAKTWDPHLQRSLRPLPGAEGLQ